MSFVYSVERILEIVGHDAEIVGKYENEIHGIASLSTAVEGDLSFLGNAKYVSEAPTSNASVLLVPKGYQKEPKEGQLYIKVESPSFALALLCRDIEQSIKPKISAGIHPTACIDDSAVIAPTTYIGPFCYIGPNASIGDSVVLESHVSIGHHTKIGDETHIFPRVVIGNHCEIGPRNRLYAGCVIGSDGYGYEFQEGAHQRVPQIGNVITEEYVDVGANTTIDRARFGSTLIGKGTKIDNLVQVGHNVKIGNHCLIVAQVGISGSTTLEDSVVIGGQAGISGHLKLGHGAMVAGASAVGRSLAPNEKVRGPNGNTFQLYNRIAILQRRLPDLFKRFSKLEKNVDLFIENHINED